MFQTAQAAPSMGGFTLPFPDVGQPQRPVVLLARSIPVCPQCVTVKIAFKTLGVPVQLVDMADPSQAALVTDLLAKATTRSLPLMFIDGVNVAGGLSCLTEIRAHGY